MSERVGEYYVRVCLFIDWFIGLGLLIDLVTE